MNIREEKPADIPGIRKLNTLAFETDAEANLVNDLRNNNIDYISLVAEENNNILGHIFFSQVDLDTDSSGVLKIMGLAPMAVLPKLQNKGIGSRLVMEGIRQCRNQGYDAIVVLGHPGYYPRFGFVPSSKYGIRSEYEVPIEAFMVLELEKGSLSGKHGVIKYHSSFGNL